MNEEKYPIIIHKKKIYKNLLATIIIIFSFLSQESIYGVTEFRLIYESLNPGLPDSSYNQSYVVTQNQQYNKSTSNNKFIAASFSNSLDDTYLCIGQKPLNEITITNNQFFEHFPNRINHIDWGAETLIPSPFENKSFIALSLDDGNNNIDFYEFNYTNTTLTLVATQAVGYPINSISWSNPTINKLLVTHEGGVHTVSFNAFAGSINSFDLITSNPAKSGGWKGFSDTFFIDNGSIIEKYVGGIFSFPSFDLTTYNPTFTQVSKIAVSFRDKVAIGTNNGHVMLLDDPLTPLYAERSHRKISDSHSTINILEFFTFSISDAICTGGICTNIYDHKIYAYTDIDGSLNGLDAAPTASSQRLSKSGPGGSVPVIYDLSCDRKLQPAEGNQGSFIIGIDGSTAIPSNSIIFPDHVSGLLEIIPPNTFSPLRKLILLGFDPESPIPGLDLKSILQDSNGFSSITDYKNNDLFFGTKNDQLYFRHTSPEDSDWLLTGTIAGSLTTTSSADTILHLPLNDKLYLLDTAGKVHVVTTAKSAIADIAQDTVITFEQVAASQTDIPAFTNLGIAKNKLFGIAESKEIFKYRNHNNIWVSAGYKPNFSNHLLSVDNAHATHYP